MEQKRTVDSILTSLKDIVESKKMLDTEKWIEAAFFLNVLLGDEHAELESMRQGIAQKKLEILKAQEKRNVAAAELETEASDEYRLFRLQEHKVFRIEELIKIAKKNSSKF